MRDHEEGRIARVIDPAQSGAAAGVAVDGGRLLQLTTGIEDLHTVVPGVGNDEVPATASRVHRPGHPEVPFLGSLGADSALELAAGAEYLDTLVHLVDGDDAVVLQRRDTDAKAVELAVPVAVLPELELDRKSVV